MSLAAEASLKAIADAGLQVGDRWGSFILPQDSEGQTSVNWSARSVSINATEFTAMAAAVGTGAVSARCRTCGNLQKRTGFQGAQSL